MNYDTAKIEYAKAQRELKAANAALQEIRAAHPHLDMDSVTLFPDFRAARERVKTATRNFWSIYDYMVRHFSAEMRAEKAA